MGAVQRFPQSFDNMTNLKLLCVLLVLVAVCGEAESRDVKYVHACGSFKMHLSCKTGTTVREIATVTFGKRYWFFGWGRIRSIQRRHKCINYAKPSIHKWCDFKQKCVINSSKIPHYYHQCAYKSRCLIVQYICY